MTDDSPKTRTITLTDRPPVRIKENEWPVLAHGHWSDHDNQYEFQANRKWRVNIRVRQHVDGRAIVYGTYDYDTHFHGERGEAHKVGALLDAGADLPASIKVVADQLSERVSADDMHSHIRDAANEAISELPPEEL